MRLFLESAEIGCRMEEQGLAWRHWDLNRDDFIWRFQEKRWASVPTEAIILAGQVFPPYQMIGKKLCCDPDQIPTERIGTGSLITEDYKRIKSQVEYEESQPNA